jgi:hypothetical protein
MRTLKAFLVIALLCAVAPAHAEETATVNPVGTYACEGLESGKKYQLDLQVVARGNVFFFAWFYQGDLQARGIGVLEGDWLAVAFFNRAVGVAVYHVTPGQLVGRWAVGDDELSTETCTQGRAA